MAHALSASQPNAVAREQVFVFFDVGMEGFEKSLDLVQPAGRRLERQSADAAVADYHPLPGHQFENFLNVLAFAEAVEEDGHGAEVDRVGPEPPQVRTN